MIDFITDENFNGDIISGLLQKQPDIKLVRVQDLGLRQAIDPVVLEHSARLGRVLLTHDRKTMPNFAYDRVRRGEKMPGVLVVSNSLSAGRAIEEILLYAICATPEELANQVRYLPIS